MVKQQRKRIAQKPTTPPPAADSWVTRGGVDPENQLDEQLRASAEREGGTIPLEQIQDRIDKDTRPLDKKHVDALAESIAVVGLIEPLVVDTKGRLLAGGHRRAAIEALKNRALDNYQKLFPSDRIPVRIMSFDAEQDPELALQIEVTENEKRRDYTPLEVKTLADRLRAAGYVDARGRPEKGKKALRPALEIIVGKSLRTVRRYLNEEKQENRTTDRFLLLRQAVSKLEKWQKTEPQSRKEKELAKKLPEIIRVIESAIEE
ncbi:MULTISPECIES: ParB N-terminal domain-containing protein [Trichocoleus]|uniref:ParB N-terminal domain-containing protein n=1 Tax=Trichocoleus desertorum GB2-A4 TaxID=2933944 RepID=A0ABV0JGL0_9CYAN|nr:ParB N-terminal domain-containing protein [Trichocoleus sp. FACHB-46]MBD1862344.1 ParB N-terminal domain-containing protein [Trichocoleus sp. FACHB-46]